MFYWVVLIITVVGSLIVSRVFSERQKEWILPFCTAYTFGLIATVGSVGGILHFAFTAFNFVIVMFLCNGFKKFDTLNNPVLKLFMIFWVYMFLIVFTGYYPIEGACTYLEEFVKTFALGYFLAMWSVKKECRFRNILIAVLMAACFTVVYSFLHGGFRADILDDYGRATLDIDMLDEGVYMNVNYAALTTSCFLPFLIVFLLNRWQGGLCKWLKTVALITISLLIVILIRTGSRNGALALIPCTWYFFCVSHSYSRKFFKLVVGLIACGVVAVGVSVSMRGVENLRAFDLVGSEQGQYTNILDQMSSGRISMYKNSLALMSPLEKIFGKGIKLTDDLMIYNSRTGEYIQQRKIGTGNAHSMYMVVFYRSGLVGMILFLIFVFAAIRQCFRLEGRGRIALLFLGIWLMTGIGEGWGMIGGHTAILAGIAMGLLTNQPVQNPELMTKRDWRLFLNRLALYQEGL